MSPGSEKGFSGKGLKALSWIILLAGAPILLVTGLLVPMAYAGLTVSPTSRGLTEGGVMLARFVYYPSLVILLLTLGAMVAAAGLLRRRDWARRLLAAVSGAWGLLGLAMVVLIVASVIFDDSASFGLSTASLTALPFALLVAIAWPLFRRLCSPQTVATLQRARHALD